MRNSLWAILRHLEHSFYKEFEIKRSYNKIFTRMKLVVLLTLLLLATVRAAEADDYNGPSEEDVIVVDKDTLEPTIYSSEDTWLL